VISKDSLGEVLATITYGWETPGFYKKWMRFGSHEFIEEMTHPQLETFSRQSKYANYFLEIFLEVIKDKKYVDRIIRHYFLFKEAVNKENPDVKGKRSKVK